MELGCTFIYMVLSPSSQIISISCIYMMTVFPDGFIKLHVL